jgi:L-seryl-tRNA(Ser) seleniumtransferase
LFIACSKIRIFIESQLYNEAAMEALKQIPPVHDILRSPELQEFRDLLPQNYVTSVIQRVLADVRRELSAAKNGVRRAELTATIAAQVARRLRESMQPSLRRVINASGVVLHTNLGRAPLPAGAIEYLKHVVTGYSNLEFDIEQGVRGKRDVHVAGVLEELLGCEAAVVVNNNAAAVLLVLNTIGEGGEVIVSRGELVEIGESFRIPDIMLRSGACLREVGSTNRTRIGDYETAINENTRLLMRVHRSNFRITGFTETPALNQFIDLGRRRGVPTFEDLGSGSIMDVSWLRRAEEPSVTESIQAGIDIISFSGDKLLGGPQAGIIAGKRLYVDRIRRNPLFRALRVDKLTVAVLEYVLKAYLRGDSEAIPIWKMLRTPQEELRTRTEAFAERMGPVAKPMPLNSVVGGGSAPGVELPSWGVALDYAGLSPAEVETRLRHSNPPVIVRVEDDRVVLDFRTVFTSDEEELLTILKQLVA